MDKQQEKCDISGAIGKIFPDVMEQLVREYPPQKGDVSRIVRIPRAEIIKRLKEALIKQGI